MYAAVAAKLLVALGFYQKISYGALEAFPLVLYFDFPSVML